MLAIYFEEDIKALEIWENNSENEVLLIDSSIAVGNVLLLLLNNICDCTTIVQKNVKMNFVTKQDITKLQCNILSY